MISNWSKLLFLKYESNLVSPDIFDNLSQDIVTFFETLEFNKILAKNENSFGSFCGETFKKGQLLYHCSDCALDETCVLCEKCFVYDVHKDHNFWYTIGSDRNGSCDCGEEDSWRNELACPRHSCEKSSVTDFSIQNYSSDSLPFIALILNFILESITAYCSKINFDGDQFFIVLYNDESHSFEDVIETLTTTLEITSEEAASIAKLVDSKGLCPIYSSSKKACERISRKINMTGLTTSIEAGVVCFFILHTNELLSFVFRKALVSLQLRKDIVCWLLQKKSVDQILNNLEIIFTFDHMLWKGFRTTFGEILNLCNSIDQISKKLIAISYCRQYRKIFDSFWKEKREAHLSITNFSVQIFTLIPVAEHIIQHSFILIDIFNEIGETLEIGYKPDVGLKFQNLRGFDYAKFSVLIHDGLNILRNVRNLESVENGGSFFVNSIESFVYLLSLLTHMELHSHKSGDHVTYDRDNYDNANYICYEIQKVAEEYARISAKLDCFHYIWSSVEKMMVSCPFFSKLLTKSEDVPLYKSTRKASFFGSLGWFFSALLKELFKLEDKAVIEKNKAIIPIKLIKIFMIDSLTRIIFSSEVRSGLWVRNGSVVQQQEYFYSSTVLYHLTYYPDVFNCIIASHFMEKSQFIELFLKYSRLNGYVSDFEQTYGIIEQLMVILINSISDNVPALDSDQILINYLCSESMTKNALVKLLPDYISEETNFRSKLLRFASLKHFNTLGTDAKLELKQEFLKKFDPFYWAVTMDVRLKSWSNIKANPEISLKMLSDKFCLEQLKNINLGTTNRLSAFYSCFVDVFELLSIMEDLTKLEFILLILFTAFVSIYRSNLGNEEDSEVKKRILKVLQTVKSRSNQFYPSIKRLISEFESNLSSDTSQTDLEDDIKIVEISRKHLIKSQKSLLMESFKKQRTAYIQDESEVSNDGYKSLIADSDHERCCVVCSESNDHGKDDDEGCEDIIGIPLQLNSNSVIKFEPSKQNKFELAFRGCYHFFHKKCFDSLPSIKGYRKCPLCESAMDLLISLDHNSTLQGTVKNINIFNNENNQTSSSNANANPFLSLSSKLESVKSKYEKYFSIPNDDIDNPVMSRNLLRPFCYIVMNLALQDISMNSIPLHQINTIIAVKNAIIQQSSTLPDGSLTLNGPISQNVSLLFSEDVNDFNSSSFPVDILQDLESLFEIYLFVINSKTDEDITTICGFLLITIKRIMARHYFLAKFNRVLCVEQIYRILNLFFNVIIHESFDKNVELFERLSLDAPEFVEFESSELVKFWQKKALYFQLAVENNLFKLIDLPHRHDTFLRQYLPMKCSTCNTVPRSSAICLLCGELVCVGDTCCRSNRKEGECTSHRIKCSGSVGLFMLVKNCALLLLCDSAGVVIPAPYVNCFGEHDIDLHSSSALYLNENLYRGVLQDMFFKNEIRDYVLRNLVNSRLQMSWNSL